MSPPAHFWVSAFARQAKADFRVWNVLQSCANEQFPSCESLHFLQMACEKLCKASLIEAGSDPESLRSSHAYIAKHLPHVIRDQLQLMKAKHGRAHAVMRFAKQIAREIELLAPAVDDGGRRPDNCEYPWLVGMKSLHVPIDWQFPVEELLSRPQGIIILKLIGIAIDYLLKNPGGA